MEFETQDRVVPATIDETCEAYVPFEAHVPFKEYFAMDMTYAESCLSIRFMGTHMASCRGSMFAILENMVYIMQICKF